MGVETGVRDPKERVLERIDAIVWSADLDPLRLTYVSPGVERILGYPCTGWEDPELWTARLHPDDRDWVGGYRADPPKAPHTLEYRMIAADGRTVWLRNTVTVETEGGRARRCHGVAVDVTDRKHAEAGAQRMIALQEATMEAVTAGVLVVDRDDRVVGYNGAFARMWGLEGGAPSATLQGRWDPTRIFDEVRIPRLAPDAETQDEIETDDGRTVQRCSRPRRVGDGVVGRVWTFHDLTAHRAVLRRAAEFEQLYECAPCAIHSLDARGACVRVNETGVEWLGRPREEIVGRAFEAALAPGSRPRFAEAWATVLRDGGVGEVELDMARADGATFPVLMSAKAVRDDGGALRTCYVVLHGIDHVKRVEEALRREEERYRYATLATRDGVYDRDLRTGHVECNAACREMFDPTDSAGDPLAWWDHMLHPDDRDAAEASLRAAFAARSPTWAAEYRIRKRDGSYGVVLDRAYLLYDEAGAPIRMIGAASDITPRRRAEDALRRSEERFRTVARLAPVGIFHLDANGRSLYINDRLWEIIGVERQELSDDGWRRRLHPDDRARVLAGWDRVLRERVHWRETYRFLRPDGDVTWVLCEVLPVELPGEESLGFIGTLTDITDRTRIEEELRRHREHLEDLVENRTRELAVANRELESFSSSVSHDLRAPLRAIDGFSRLLEEDLGQHLTSEGIAYIARIRQGAQRMALLIDDLLRLSRVSRAQLVCEPVNLTELALATVDDLRVSSADRVVHVVIQPDMVVEGDRPLLRILVDNLLGNAWKFTSKNPTANIRFFSEEVGGRTVFRVQDDGVGFDPAFAGHLFRTFNRLHSHDEFEGTGIGLATVRRVVERHGGAVWAEAQLGRGATVSFTLQDHCRRRG